MKIYPTMRTYTVLLAETERQLAAEREIRSKLWEWLHKAESTPGPVDADGCSLITVDRVLAWLSRQERELLKDGGGGE